MRETKIALWLLIAVLTLLMILFPPQKPDNSLAAGSDMFWETYEAEFKSCCPSEDEAARLLRQRGFEVSE